MIDLKRILVATDFSDHSSKAVQYGAELAAKFDAELHLLHAVDPTPIAYGEGAFYPPNSTTEIIAAAAQQLDELSLGSVANVRVTRKVIEGTPFVEIVRYAKESTADLLIIGTHGRGAVAHMLLGSVAEKVVRKAPCPVLVVRDEEHDFVMP